MAANEIPKPHTPDRSEVEELREKLQAASDEIVGLNATLRLQSAKMGRLLREDDPLKRAKQHQLWPRVERLFDYWRRHSGHPKAKLDVKRFRLARPFLEEEGDAMCARAILGVCQDPWRPSNSSHVHNWWEDAFRDRASFERACNKARDFRPEPWMDV